MKRTAYLLTMWTICFCAVTACGQSSGATSTSQPTGQTTGQTPTQTGQKPAQTTPSTPSTQPAAATPATQAAPAAQTTPAAQAAAPLREPDVIYVPTPPEVVDEMLKVAKVGKGDVLYDLGSGDGRIVITAAQKYGITRGVGIDINPERIKEANANAKTASVADRVSFLNADLFEANIKDATVVTLYLLPELNVKLLPKLLSDLKPGTRIVSHSFEMGSWKPEQTLNVNGRTVHFWTIPAKGTPAAAAAAAAAAASPSGTQN